jgi:hypothetical protein
VTEGYVTKKGLPLREWEAVEGYLTSKLDLLQIFLCADQLTEPAMKPVYIGVATVQIRLFIDVYLVRLEALASVTDGKAGIDGTGFPFSVNRNLGSGAGGHHHTLFVYKNM